jgi:hypothetical protein
VKQLGFAEVTLEFVTTDGQSGRYGSVSRKLRYLALHVFSVWKKILTFTFKIVYSQLVWLWKPRALREYGNQKRKEVIMSMKKLLSFALCLVIAMAFAAGCKKKEEAPPAPAPEAAAPAPAQAPMSSVKAPEAAPAPAAPAEKPADKK